MERRHDTIARFWNPLWIQIWARLWNFSDDSHFLATAMDEFFVPRYTLLLQQETRFAFCTRMIPKHDTLHSMARRSEHESAYLRKHNYENLETEV
jgi:hypothetical protein